jgi:hypothetical protein
LSAVIRQRLLVYGDRQALFHLVPHLLQVRLDPRRRQTLRLRPERQPAAVSRRRGLVCTTLGTSLGALTSLGARSAAGFV